MVGMEFGSSTRGNATETEGDIAGFAMVNFSEMGSSDLIKLVLQADVARRQLDGYVAGLLGRLGQLEGDEAVAAVCSQFGISGYKARKQAKTAGTLNGLPNILQAAKDGWITMDHAQLVAESHARVPLDLEEELELIPLAIKLDCDHFRKTLATMEDQRQAEDGLSRTERQRARRFAKVFDGDDEMVVVYAELDRIAGERVRAALEQLNSRMLRDDSVTGEERTFEQRNADALVALISQQPAARTNQKEAAVGADSEEADCGDLSPQKTTLVVSVDYDVLDDKLENAGLIDGTPIDVDELRHIACDADIVPVIFSADGQPLWLGRKQRSVTQAQKLALCRRDRGCIGCGLRPTACDAHHIKWWDQGGPTDITNLVLLCPRCHKRVHKQGYLVEQDPNTGRFVVKPPQKQPPDTRPLTRRPRQACEHQPEAVTLEQVA